MDADLACDTVDSATQGASVSVSSDSSSNFHTYTVSVIKTYLRLGLRRGHLTFYCSLTGTRNTSTGSLTVMWYERYSSRTHYQKMVRTSESLYSVSASLSSLSQSSHLLFSQTLIDVFFFFFFYLCPISHSKYPSTPSRIQLSIWPAGTSTSAQGTIDWAGGYIDWSDADYTSNGYFWNTIQSVKVSCADDQNTTTVGTTGWAYGGNDSTGVPVS